MLFDEEKREEKVSTRPAAPADFNIAYDIGFLFNFASVKSTRFDFEPILIFNLNGVTEYKRISLQVDRGLAFLHALPDGFYRNVLGFSDNSILQWMTNTGNRFLRNHSGSWAHASAKELVNLRKHYRELLRAMWPDILQQKHLFIHRAGKFNNLRPEPVGVSAEQPGVSFKARNQNGLLHISMQLTLGGEVCEPKVVGGIMLEHQQVLYLPENAEVLSLIDLFRNGPITFPLSIKKDIVTRYLGPWSDRYPTEIDPRLDIHVVSPEPDPSIMLSELNESNLMIRPQFRYGTLQVDYSEDRFTIEEAGHAINIVRRDRANETSLYEWLRSLHPTFAQQRNNQYYYLPFSDVMKRGWFITMLRSVQQKGYTIRGWDQLRKFRYTTHEPKLSINATSDEHSFFLKVTIAWGDQQVPLKELRHAILKAQDTLMLEDGTLGHIPDEWISQYSLLFRTAVEDEDTLRISKMHFTLLDTILDKIEGSSVLRDIETRKDRMVNFDAAAKPVSAAIKASLRPYQLSGLNWLRMLDECGFGGCLADDMGLGKTLQTISFLQHVKETYPGSTQLVVCPTSLIFNWESEMQKFCPSLRFYTHYGTQREFTRSIFDEYDVVLTSYGVVRNDLEHLAEYFWQYLILDESQAIKNPDAQVTKAVQQLRAVNRVILSGTPVQNNTSDLFSQFNFLNPGLLGSREFFNREFATPIDKLGSREKTEQLKRIIHPFTLRRTKEQVAKDLPDKTVTVLWCTMDAHQRSVYNEYRDRYRTRLLKKIDEEGIARSGMDVLEGLLRLRQICDHTALVSSDREGGSSVKTEELVREVTENAGNHKLLIFSQFTEMLQLLKTNFDDAGISYCYLDGSTSLPKRKEEVERFQEDESIKAFLISLKAGGVGLNLTVADYVYLVDPWWNPAAEQQAIDRAHRIGQKRKVFAYKMICKDTVEEKILRMQEKKKMLADDLIQEDAGFVKNLSREDIEFLFG